MQAARTDADQPRAGGGAAGDAALTKPPAMVTFHGMTLAEALDSLPLTALDRVTEPFARLKAGTQATMDAVRHQTMALVALREANAIAAETVRVRAMLEEAAAELAMASHDAEELQRAMDALHAKEMAFAEHSRPLRETLARQLAETAARRGPAAGVWRRADEIVLEAGTSLLEAFRDARLRLAMAQADTVNRDAEASPVFDNADDLLAWLKSSAAE